jgi:hypothetical protein
LPSDLQPPRPPCVRPPPVGTPCKVALEGNVSTSQRGHPLPGLCTAGGKRRGHRQRPRRFMALANLHQVLGPVGAPGPVCVCV